MKMGKKVREYKSGDFIFAKVKGYPAWPARVQKLNGKKYFVYFYGTGETANLPPNMIFDYAENKEKFLTKTVKRRDFNDGVKQIEYDFANNVPLEQVIGVVTEPSEDAANDTANDTANEVDDSTADTTAADDTIADESAANTTQNDTGIEDSDETGGLVIDEAKAKGKKSVSKTPAKDTPKAAPKTPRGKGKKEDGDEKEKDNKEKEEELVSRSGRKIRPKRYMDEHTEENTTLPSPAPKKRRGTSPGVDKDTRDKAEKIIKHFNNVTQSELEDLKEPFTPDEPDKENILIAYLPSGQYVGIKLFQSRPTTFKNEAARLQWDKQAASNALTLKTQLERGHITAQSVVAQLNMDLSLTDEEKAMLDKDRETEEKKSRVQFLKTEMKLIELDAKIKTCLCLEKADTELCLKLLDELMELEVKPLMLLKHPSCLETIKRMRAYVGNTPSWDLSESAALVFSKHAHRIRKLADTIYNNMRQLFTTPEGLSFWEYFSERVMQFKKATSKLSADELLELVHEPIEMSQPSPHTMKSAVDSANEVEASVEGQKKKPQAGRNKKNANTTPSKPPLKRQNSKKQQNDKEDNEEETDKSENEKDKEKDSDTQNADSEKTNDTEKESNNTDDVEESTEKTEDTEESEKDTEDNKNDELNNDTEKTNDAEMEVDEDLNSKEEESKEDSAKESTKEAESTDKVKDKSKDSDKEDAKDKKEKDKPKESADKSKDSKDKPNGKEKKDNGEKKDSTQSKDKAKDSTDRKDRAEKRKLSTESKKEQSPNAEDKVNKDKDSDKEKDKDSPKEDEPRAKRTRESKKTEPPPPRSPTKRKSKA
ncbi:PC4 and SFRS1-interacting protein-like [Colias croceus]|uniref:PC4 and SFRS1-interacting protein-like n=1 Tax=Colias crocea TaxID=72248 RepID=UPI001E27C9EB|nr:PC4 and SFRS1-interacting protein-like [Colias croceus]XP_045508237.1 PC4 and SFRS1-interacting protein-like [Colias croceus]